LSEIARVNLGAEFDEEEVRERHRIYCHLLMKLIHRFWSTHAGRSEPIRSAPNRSRSQGADGKNVYRGDLIGNPEGSRVNGDSYLRHNIAAACERLARP
jgi:hypothetical protein